jgi:DNA-binding transcriptional LysR family regulator
LIGRERMNFHQIEAFRAVMMTGSMTEAADVMRTSQPRISRLIAQLEAAVGFRLFIRGNARLQPTAEANAFYREVDRVFAGLNTLSQTVKNIRSFGTGNVRIACLPALAFGFVPRAIRRFTESHPEINISLQTRSSWTVMEWTATQQCDLGLAAKGPDMKGVTGELFLSVPGVCVLPAQHRLASEPEITPQALKGENFISLGLIDLTRGKVDQAFSDAGVERVMKIETQYAATVCACVAEGLGVSIVNPFVALDWVGRGIVVKPFRPAIMIEKMLVYPTNKPPSRLTEAFVETLRTCRDEELKLQAELLGPAQKFAATPGVSRSK